MSSNVGISRRKPLRSNAHPVQNSFEVHNRTLLLLLHQQICNAELAWRMLENSALNLHPRTRHADANTPTESVWQAYPGSTGQRLTACGARHPLERHSHQLQGGPGAAMFPQLEAVPAALPQGHLNSADGSPTPEPTGHACWKSCLLSWPKNRNSWRSCLGSCWILIALRSPAFATFHTNNYLKSPFF